MTGGEDASVGSGDGDGDGEGEGEGDGDRDGEGAGGRVVVAVGRVVVAGGSSGSSWSSGSGVVVGTTGTSVVGGTVDSMTDGISDGRSEGTSSLGASLAEGGSTSIPSPQLSGDPVAFVCAPPTVTRPDETVTAAGSAEYQAAPALVTSPSGRLTTRASGR